MTKSRKRVQEEENRRKNSTRLLKSTNDVTKIIAYLTKNDEGVKF